MFSIILYREGSEKMFIFYFLSGLYNIRFQNWIHILFIGYLFYFIMFERIQYKSNLNLFTNFSQHLCQKILDYRIQ